MNIDFWPPNSKKSDDPFVRQWPVLPRKGETICFADDPKNRTFYVKQVYWGDMVNGEGQPITDQPCVAVALALECSWCEGKREPGEKCACTEEN